jgi:hypothetical protein
MTYLVYLYVRASYAVHRRLHGKCEQREIRAYHIGYLRAIQDEQSKVYNATLERQLRDVIARSGW